MGGRKLALVALAAALALETAACGAKTIKGSVKTVVDAAQELSTDETATFEVTGEITIIEGEAGEQGDIFLEDSDDCVFAIFDELPDGLAVGDRVTVIGGPRDTSDAIGADSLILDHCKIK